MSLYDVLNVPKNSKKSEIEKAYKKMAKKVHPLINKKGDSEFINLNRAYSILKDDYKRDFYNLAGDGCINLLDNEKDSFAIVRMFDRINILCYTFFVLGFVFNLLLLPVCIYYKISNISFLGFVFLGGFLVLPLIRNLFRLKYFYVKQLCYITFRYIVFTRFIVTTNKWILLAITAIEIGLIFISLEKLTKRSLFYAYGPFLINYSCVVICKYFKGNLLSVCSIYFILHSYLFFNIFRSKTVVFISTLFIYFFPIVMLKAGVLNKLIFVPLAFLGVILIMILYAGIKIIRENIPLYNPKRKELECQL